MNLEGIEIDFSDEATLIETQESLRQAIQDIAKQNTCKESVRVIGWLTKAEQKLKKFHKEIEKLDAELEDERSHSSFMEWVADPEEELEDAEKTIVQCIVDDVNCYGKKPLEVLTDLVHSHQLTLKPQA